MRVSLADHFTYKKIFLATFASILMMIFSSVYSIVDGIFLSQFSGDGAFSGANLIFPYIMILGGVGFMFGTGGSALVSKTLGEQDKQKASEYFSLIIYSLIVIGIILALVGYFTIEPMAKWMASLSSENSTAMLDYAIRYGKILALGLPLFMLQNVFQSFFVTDEKPLIGFAFVLLAGLTNIGLDALFIGALNWSVEGAAYATVTGWFIAGFIPILFFFFKKDGLISLGKTHFEGGVLLKTCSNGCSEFFTNIASSVVSISYNAQLLRYIGPDGVSAYAIIMYLSYAFMAIYTGYAIGLAPIIGYHYGAKNTAELHNLLKKSLIILAIAGVCMFSLSQGLASIFAGFFANGNDSLKELSINSIRIYSFVFLTSGFSIFASSFFTALSNGMVSAIISIVRSIVFELVCIFTMPLLFGVNGVWAAGPIAEIGSTAMTIFFFVKMKKKYQY